MFKRGFIVLVVALLCGCTLPGLDGRTVSHAMPSHEGADTRLGRSMASLASKYPTLSGVLPLSDPLDAFASRMVLVGAAERTIDIQYYIWRDDITGNLLLHALREAARRQVRVRLLIDDNGTSGLDAKLAVLNAEPNIEVRLFNPFPTRRFKAVGFLTDFRRLNRRMHNKSLTVDGQVTIVGGRNIGDEYFGAKPDFAFADLDVLVSGAVIDEVSADFDLYWHSESAYPLERLIDMPDERVANAFSEEAKSSAEAHRARAYVQAVRQSKFLDDLAEGTLAMEWVPVRMVSDDPAKVLGDAPPHTMLFQRLAQVLDTPRQSVDLVSPYFVPTQQGVAAFGEMVDQGVRVRVLTNALEATDVTAVHAGYAKYRVPLLKRGVELFEMRRQDNESGARDKAGPFGSSGSSLHAKTFAVDGKRVFVGSFNFDPRSAELNTELGFVIASERMAREIDRSFREDVSRTAYQLQLDDEGELRWLSQGPDGPVTLTSEPSTSAWRRFYVDFLSLLPIEPLL